jgi:hypothetical protein
MSILGVDRIYYGAANVGLATRFHKDYGLDCVEESASGADFRLLNDTSVHIRRAADGKLPPAKIDWAGLSGSTAREVIWGVDTSAALDAIGAELGKDREVRADNEGVLHSVDDQGYHIGFMVTKRKPLKATLPDTNTVDHIGRLNRVAEGSIRKSASPYRIGHVVYWAQGDVARFAKFYTERLGFKVTDNMSRGGLFMRCAGSNDHHSLLLNGGPAYGFQHVAYEFRDIDDVMFLGTQVERGGWKTNVGPLRHNVSSTFSWYIWNPAGGLAEAYSDMDCVDDNWVVRTFRPGEDPTFYGSSWKARPEQGDTPPAMWKNDVTAPGFPEK